jgi:hypothetical protein
VSIIQDSGKMVSLTDSAIREVREHAVARATTIGPIFVTFNTGN